MNEPLKQFILLLSTFIVSCNHSVDSISVSKPQAIFSSKKDSSISPQKNIENNIENTTPNKIRKKNDSGMNNENPESFELIGESYSDKNWNGEPVNQQLILTQKVINEFPDTLNKIAISLYKNFENRFPRAIADNFEKDLSKEIIYYPNKLIFNFELFEKINSKKPYSTRVVNVIRESNGNLKTE